MKEMGKTGWLVEAAANHTTLCLLPSFLPSSSFQILPFVSTDKWRPSDAKREKERKSEKKVKTILFLSVSNNGGREQRYSELMVVSAFAAFAVLLFPSLSLFLFSPASRNWNFSFTGRLIRFQFFTWLPLLVLLLHNANDNHHRHHHHLYQASLAADEVFERFCRFLPCLCVCVAA